MKRNSDSALMDHFFTDTKTHKIYKHHTMVLGQEKQPLKRKIMETLCIRTNSADLCNLGTSIDLELAWDMCLQRVRAELEKRKRINAARVERHLRADWLDWLIIGIVRLRRDSVACARKYFRVLFILIAGLVVSTFTFVFCSSVFRVRQHQPDEVLPERTKRCSFPVKEHQLLGRK